MKSLSVKRKSLTLAWRHSLSSTKRTPGHLAYSLPKAEAAAAVEAAVTAAAEAVATVVATLAGAEVATVAAEVAMEVAEAAEAAESVGGAAVAAAESGAVGYGPNGAGFGLANENPACSRAKVLRSGSIGGSGGD